MGDETFFANNQFCAVRFNNSAAVEVFMAALKLSMDYVGMGDDTIILLRKGYQTKVVVEMEDQSRWSVQFTTRKVEK